MIKEEYKEYSSSEDESDDDICSIQDIDEFFHYKYKIADESTTSLKKDYILNMCSDQSFGQVACGLSNSTVCIFEISNQNGLFPKHNIEITNTKSEVCGVQFLDESPNYLLVGTNNGQVRLFDLRTSKQQICFDAIANDTQKAITCFDRNANSRVLCMGSEFDLQNVYLFFFDIRKTTALGAYFESHSEDITAVRFHPKNPDILITGSTDGLVNIFDISKTSEDDAIIKTVNTESSVQKLNWHKSIYDKDVISCITGNNGFKMYKSDEGESIVEFERSKITEVIRIKSIVKLNLINCHNMADENLFLLAGSTSKRGKILRSATLQNKVVLSHADFEGNKQIIRESLYDLKSNNVVTAGESAIVSLWCLQTDKANLQSSAKELKSKSNKSRIHGKTPY